MLALDTLRDAGLTLELTSDHQLRVTPARLLTPALQELIKAKKAALIYCLLEPELPDILEEPPGYEGTGWRISGGKDLRPETLAKFYSASKALDARIESTLQKQEIRHDETH